MDIKLPYRVFAVDPATGNSGWTVLDLVSLHPLKIRIVKTGAIDGEKLVRLKKEIFAIFGRQFTILEALLDEYITLLTLYNPDAVVVEGAYGHVHMNALISLTLATHELRRAARQVLNKNLEVIPPTITKRAFTGSGSADKDHMRLAYQTNDYLEGVVPDEEISEHEIDAVGHGVGHIKRDITQEVIQISAKEKRQIKKDKADRKKQKETQ